MSLLANTVVLSRAPHPAFRDSPWRMAGPALSGRYFATHRAWRASSYPKCPTLEGEAWQGVAGVALVVLPHHHPLQGCGVWGVGWWAWQTGDSRWGVAKSIMGGRSDLDELARHPLVVFALHDNKHAVFGPRLEQADIFALADCSKRRVSGRWRRRGRPSPWPACFRAIGPRQRGLGRRGGLRA